MADTARQWLEWEIDPSHRETVNGWLSANNEAALSQHFGRRIAFGTAGLRARMAPGTAFMNQLIILQTCQGIAKYLEETSPSNKSVIIGHDHRHNSRTFSHVACAVFRARGFRVLAFPGHVPTPYVPFGVGHFGCAMGVMITASHNPKDDNGFKVYAANTSQIISPMDSEIQAHIMANLSPWQAYDVETLRSTCTDVLEEVREKYNQFAIEQCASGVQAEKTLQFVYTAMHGVGDAFVASLLSQWKPNAEITRVESQCTPDPDFPTVSFPNPEEKHALDRAMAVGDEKQIGLILANDPDADRLAVAVKDSQAGRWVTLSGNETGLLFADWVWAKYVEKNPDYKAQGKKPFMLASTVSSKVIQRMAAKEGFDFFDTLTGFKWMGNKADALQKEGHDFLFAYEVEIGFLTGKMSLDKDGIRMAGVFLELASHWQNQGLSLLQRLDQLYAKYNYHFMVNTYFFCYKLDKMVELFDHLKAIYTTLPHLLSEDSGISITGVRDLRNNFDSTQPGNVPLLPHDPFMITFYLSDHSVCTIRGSGTEPKLKYYIEVNSPSREGLTDKAAALTKLVVTALLQPERFGFVAPAS